MRRLTIGRARRKSAKSSARNREGFTPSAVCDRNLISSLIWFSVNTYPWQKVRQIAAPISALRMDTIFIKKNHWPQITCNLLDSPHKSAIRSNQQTNKHQTQLYPVYGRMNKSLRLKCFGALDSRSFQTRLKFFSILATVIPHRLDSPPHSHQTDTHAHLSTPVCGARNQLTVLEIDDTRTLAYLYKAHQGLEPDRGGEESDKTNGRPVEFGRVTPTTWNTIVPFIIIVASFYSIDECRIASIILKLL